MPWILKVIGISAIGEVGGPSARRLLEQYSRDGDSYLEINTTVEEPLIERRTETKRFDTLAADALNSITRRRRQNHRPRDRIPVNA